MSKTNNKFQTFNVLSVAFIHWTHDIYTAFLAPLLPVLKEKLSISYSWLGLLAVMQRIPTLLNLFIGIIAERILLRYILILAPSITAISMSLIGIANNVVVLATLLFISGVSSMFFHIPASVLVKKLSGEKIGRGMSFYMVGGEFARTMGPTIVIGAYTLWGLEGIWKVALFGVLTSIFMFFRFKKIEVSSGLTEKKFDLKEYKNTFRKHLPILGAIAFFNLMRAGLKASFTTYLPSYINELEGGLVLGAVMLSILQFSGVIGIFFAGSISDKLGRKESLLVLAIVTPIVGLLYVLSSGILSYVFIVLLGLCIFSTSPIVLAVVHEIKTEHLSFINGIYLTINFLFGAVMVYLTGVLADYLGFEVTYITTSVLSIVSIPFVYKMFRK
jgi:FSR family fosmidomycin resistance protein-like MFS transporter